MNEIRGQMNIDLNDKARSAKTAKQALVAVEWILKNVGWCKHSYHKYDDASGNLKAACLLGALELVLAEPNTKADADYLLEEQVYNETGRRGVVAFNDDNLTTKEDVLKLVKGAIKRA